MKKLFLALFITALTPLSAFAWKAMSVTYSPVPLVYTSHEMGTQEEARNEAQKRCRSAAVVMRTGPENCRPFGQAFSGETVVVVHGENGLVASNSKEPKEALAMAMLDCRKVSRTCAPLAAAHSNQVRFAGLAFSQTHGYFAVTNEPTQEAANAKVLSICEQYTKGECGSRMMGMMHIETSYAVAVSADGANQTLQRGTTTDSAQRNAIAKCEAETKKKCLASSHFNPVTNTWVGSLTKAQVATLAEVQKDAQRNSQRLFEHHARTTQAEPPAARAQPQERKSAPKQDMGPCLETRVYRGHEADVIRTPGCY